MKKILITGGTGFVGKHLLSALNSDYDITLLGRTANQNYKNIECDLLIDEVSSNWFENIDTIFHLAGLAHTDLNQKTIKIQHERINYQATIDLVQKAAQKKVKLFIFLSSVKAQTAFQSSKRISEDDNSYPEGEYGISKKKQKKRL